MKRRGAARVLGIDTDERYLKQARFAADVTGLDVVLQADGRVGRGRICVSGSIW